ncbi:hypothetical protein IHE44_0003480 [Lamprotornis superbus]|uniref:Uncharacterized protein n=1 Tax=Lamprotornis superbus TaxID=245042 RepID=A0A835NTJ4_9PASS|nr:hypothetical protein IHE44_0003480 [Lamprotornis superbus]
MNFQSIIQPDLRRRGYTSSSYSGYHDGRGPPAHPRRRMGRINHWGGGPSPPPMAGGKRLLKSRHKHTHLPDEKKSLVVDQMGMKRSCLTIQAPFRQLHPHPIS